MAANVQKSEMIAWVEAAECLGDVADAADADAADDAGVAPDSIASSTEPTRKFFERRRAFRSWNMRQGCICNHSERNEPKNNRRQKQQRPFNNKH